MLANATRAGLLVSALALSAGCTQQFVEVSIDSNPTSAEVWVGEVQRDSTPCTLLFDEAGEFEVHIRKAGYSTIMRRVTVIDETGERRRYYGIRFFPPNS